MNWRASAHYTQLAPKLLDAMPAPDADYLRVAELWVKVGSPGSISATRACLGLLASEGTIDFIMRPVRRGCEARAYRLAARAKVEEATA